MGTSDTRWSCPSCGRSIVLCVKVSQVAHRCTRGPQKGTQRPLVSFRVDSLGGREQGEGASPTRATVRGDR